MVERPVPKAAIINPKSLFPPGPICGLLRRMSTELNPVIRQKLEAFAQRWQGMVLMRGACEGIVVLLVAMTVVGILDWLFILPDGLRWSLSGLGYAITLGVVWWNCLRLLWRLPDARGLARMIEKAEPSLREDLISAVELSSAGNESYYDSEVFRSLLQSDVGERVQGLRVETLLPTKLISRWLYSAAGLVAVCAALLLLPGSPFGVFLARAMAPMANVERISATKIELVEPAAGDLLVPRGDNVPVLVRITGSDPSKVTLEVFHHDEKIDDERVLMSLVGEREFSATIPAHDSRLEYRIRAGDGITRKFSIETQPRPQVVEFEKTFAYPAYSRLAANTVREENGDLTGLEGTEISLRLKLDQPVTSAALRVDYGTSKATLPLTAAGERMLTGRVTLQNHGTYQIQLIAAGTGFENKFSPQYELRPIPDLVPRVSIDSPAKDLIVPPDEVVQLEGTAVDDVGLRSIAQHIRVNNREWIAVTLETNFVKQTSVSRSWDLLPLGASPGDQIITKLVAIDVKGNKAESSPLTLHVSSPNFDAKRLAALQAKRRVRTALAEVRDATTELDKNLSGEAAKSLERGDEQQRKQAVLNASAALEAAEQKLAQAGEQLKAAIPQATAGREASDLALADRVLSQMQNDSLAQARARLDSISQERPPGQPAPGARDLQRAASKAASDARELEQSFRDMVSADEAALAAANLSYLAREQVRMNQLAKQSPADDPATWDRLARQQNGAAKESALVEQTLGELAKTAQHGQGDRAKRTAQELQKAREPLEQALTNGVPNKLFAQPSEKMQRAVEQALNNALPMERELAQHADRARERLGKLAATHADQLEQVRRSAEELANAERKLAEQQDKKQNTSSQTAKVDELKDKLAREWQAASAQLKDRADAEELRRDADSQFVADTAKAAQALSAMRAATAGEQQGQQSVESLKKLEEAVRTVEAGHRLTEARRALDQLTEKERWEAQTADAVTARPREWEWLKKSLEQTPNELRKAKLPEEAARAANEAAHSHTANQVRDEMTRRQHEGRNPSNPRPPQPVDAQLAGVSADLQKAAEQAQPKIDAARQAISQAAPSMSQMMEGLARASEQLEQSTRNTAQSAPQSPTATPEPTNPAAANPSATAPGREPEQLLANQQGLNQQVNELKDALRRDANVQDAMDADARARARDADDSVAMLREPPAKAADALREAVMAQQPSTEQRALTAAADQQQKLAETLKQLAQHYRNLEAGKPEESRTVLRQAEEELGIKTALDAAYDRAQQLAELGQKTPQEMLAELERELPKNEIMQRELDNISDRALEAAKSSLEHSTRQEENIGKQLANLSQTQERKNAIMDQAKKLADETRALAEQKMPPIRRDSSAAETGAQPEVQRAEQSLQSAAQQAASGKEQSLEQAAKQMSEAAKGLQQASTDLKATEAKAGQARQNLSPTDSKAAAAQAAQSQSAQAAQKADELAQQAKKLADELGQMANQSGAQMAQAAGQQASISQNVDQAGADIGRAGRHEQRLGTPQGMALQQVGDQTQKIAGQQVPEAQSKLASRENPAAAQQAVQAAQQAMQQQLNELAQAMQMAANKSMSSGAESQPGEPGQQGSPQGQQGSPQQGQQSGGQSPAGQASSEESRQMARTLDRLDSALNTTSGQQQPGQQSGQQSAQQAAQQAMASAAQAQQSQMKSQRQNGSTPGQQSPSEQPGDGSGAELIAMDHEPGELPIIQAMKRADWAKLPPKLAQGLMEAQREGTAAEYRTMVETYFRVLAERGKQKGQ